MAISVQSRPEAYITKGPIRIESSFESGGDIVFVCDAGHGLGNGNEIIMYTPNSFYNGYGVAGNVISLFQFKLCRSLADLDTSTFVDFDGNITNGVLQILSAGAVRHKWSCVHLPIVYELASTSFPISDAFGTIDTFSDNGGGYTRIVLTGAPSGGGFDITDTHYRIVGAGALDGIYRFINNAVFTDIDLPYNAGNTSLEGALIYVYRNNYHVLVNVYAGLSEAHTLGLDKPYELVATLQITPDNDNELKFSIANEIKKQIDVLTCNLTGATLPNDITAFCMFYIEYAESYDIWNETTEEIETFTDEYTSDKLFFEGFAANAKLPFKNLNSGYLGNYIVDESTLYGAEFLTLFERPVIFEDHYFDISAIINYENIIYYDITSSFLVNRYVNSNGPDGIISTQIDNKDAGVYRIPVVEDCSYEYILSKIQKGYPFTRFDLWDHVTTCSGQTWATPTKGSDGTIQASLSTATEGIHLFSNFVFIANDLIRSIRLPVVVDVSGAFSGQIFFRVSLESTTTPITCTHGGFVSDWFLLPESSITAPGTYSDTVFFPGPFTGNPTSNDVLRMGINVDTSSMLSGTPTITITFSDSENMVPLYAVTISDEKRIDQACNCQPITDGIYLQWLNYLGGFDRWLFKGNSDHQIEIKESTERNKNIFPSWPDSYGINSQAIRQETSRKSCIKKTIRSQEVSLENLQAMQYIKTSPLVQILDGTFDIRTVLVDKDSFVVFNDGDKTYTIEFTIEYTDYIPSQTL